MHILHSPPAALIRRGNIAPVHKIMQHSGRQFLQSGIFLRPEDELLNAVGFFLLLGTPRGNYTCLLDRGGVQYDPTGTAHSIGELGQRNKDRSRSEARKSMRRHIVSWRDAPPPLPS